MAAKKAARKKGGNGRRKKQPVVPEGQLSVLLPEVAEPPIPTPLPLPAALPTEVPAQPVVQPALPPMELPPQLPTPQRVTFSAVRGWFRVRVQTLLAASLSAFREQLLPRPLTLPNELLRDIDNVLCCVETYAYGADPEGLGTRKLVGSYTRLMEVTLHWITHVKEEIGKIERALEVREAQLDVESREELRKLGAAAVKENAVKAGIAANPARQKLVDLLAEWTTLKFQLQNIVASLRVEIIVQDSVWVQRELGYRDPSLAGSQAGPSYSG